MEQDNINKIRRHDRAKDELWIRDFILRAPMGTMATEYEGQPFLVTRNFAYDPETHAIYMHGAKKGRTIENVAAQPQVCFSASEMGRLLPDERAMEFGVEFAGVVAFGHISLVADPQEAKHGLQLLCDKYFPHLKPDVDYEPTTDTDLKVTAVLRIDIDSWSGKEKRVADDFPGAFYYEEK
ncbi:MAG: pyridoxamine 5'-phosphate oxidase family protein [Chloroflexi bacterium]|nr:pyridoxamine 5'-phosphate oxidase family protein [Chloroflexota bacterium]